MKKIIILTIITMLVITSFTAIGSADLVKRTTSISRDQIEPSDPPQQHQPPNTKFQIQEGWPFNINTGSSSYVGSPIIADIDNDKDLEIIAGTYSGYVYAWHHDGALVTGWPVFVNGQALTPSVGDLDGDGYMEIIVGTPQPSVTDNLFVFRYNGEPFNDGWPKGSEINYISDAPALADIDGDGDLEIIVGGEDYKIHAWHHDGTKVSGWPKYISSQDASTPSIGDIDNDGEPEIVVVQEWITGTSKISAWNPNGGLVSGWPKSVPGSYYPPVLGDIDGDNQLEVVAGCTDKLYAFEGNGEIIPGWPKIYTDSTLQITCLGDIDGDGVSDIIAVSGGLGNSGISKIDVFKGNGSSLNNWPFEFDGFWNPAWIKGAVVGNVDMEPNQEIIATVYDSFRSDAYLYIINHDGTILNGYPKELDIEYNSIPAISDLDSDGDIEVAAFGNDYYQKYFYVYDLPGYCYNRKIEWPMIHHDSLHTGLKQISTKQLIINSPPSVLSDEIFEVKIETIDRPIENTKVRFLGVNHYTNQNGIVQLKAPNTANDTIELIIASKAGYWTDKEYVKIMKDKDLFIASSEEVIEAENFSIAITTVGNKPVVNATVFFYNQSKNTDANGNVTFTAPDVTNDTYLEIKVVKDGYVNGTKTIKIIDHRVINQNTNEEFITIQSAINDFDTKNGHTIYVKNGIFYEDLVITKGINLIGENRYSTIIAGEEKDRIIDIGGSSNYKVLISGFTILCNEKCKTLIYIKSKSAIITNNILKNNTQCNYKDGIEIDSCNNIISNNYISNLETGIEITMGADNNSIIENIIDHNSKFGIDLYIAGDNLIKKNIITNNQIGIILESVIKFNTVIENTISENDIGIKIPYGSDGNLLYHNNLINNYNCNAADSANNFWDNGYPDGGNYWDDHLDPHDDFQGPDQNINGSDGIIDLGLPSGGLNPYLIYGYGANQDNYPLTEQYQG